MCRKEIFRCFKNTSRQRPELLCTDIPVSLSEKSMAAAAENNRLSPVIQAGDKVCPLSRIITGKMTT